LPSWNITSARTVLFAEPTGVRPMAHTKRHSAALDKVSDLLGEALSIVRGVEQDKQLVVDGRSDRWHAGEKGREAVGELSLLDQAASSIEAAQEFLGELRAE